MTKATDIVELHWPGKYRPDGSLALPVESGASLRERERFGGHGQLLPSEALVLGDNMLVLEALVRDHAGSVDLIYIDPPFATGNAYAISRKLPDGADLRLPAFDDAWTDGIAGFLRMLDPRLRLIHALLAPRGSLYVHVDPTVGHAVKLLLDEIFGRASFQREIVWRIGWVSGFKTRARNWIRNHDLIFFYTKHPTEFTFHKAWVPRQSGYQRRAGAPAMSPGIAIDDVWNAGAAELELSGCDSLDSIQIKSFSREKTGWATQKNESLLRRIIAASSDPGDVVVDVFGGSGTTAAVAHALGRRFLVADHSEAAIQIARDRLLDLGIEHLRVYELDETERRIAVAEAGSSLQEWMLAQLEAEPSSGLHGIVGRRGDVGVALGLPDQLIEPETLIAIRTAAREAGLASVELVAFDWAPALSCVDFGNRRVDEGPELVHLQAGRGLWQPAVRKISWLRGGVGVWERPRVEVERAEDRLHLRAINVKRPGCVPEPLRGQDSFAAVVGWSLMDAEGSVIFATRRRGTNLERLSGPMPASELRRPLRLAIDDVRGHRCVLWVPVENDL